MRKYTTISQELSSSIPVSMATEKADPLKLPCYRCTTSGFKLLCGFDNDILSWVESYLTNRFQAVWIDHAMSDFLPSTVGVPQGSNLGPLLFLIFYNDLPFLLDCEADAYADDTTMTVAGDTVEEIGTKMTDN